jgi:hypothetical protein
MKDEATGPGKDFKVYPGGGGMGLEPDLGQARTWHRALRVGEPAPPGPGRR